MGTLLSHQAVSGVSPRGGIQRKGDSRPRDVVCVCAHAHVRGRWVDWSLRCVCVCTVAGEAVCWAEEVAVE